MTIRPTTLADYSAIRALLVVAGLAGDYFTLALFTRMLARNHGLYLVAEADDAVVGTIFATHDGGYLGYLYKVAVHEDYRRRGIATALILEAKRVLREQAGVVWVYAHVDSGNDQSLALFASTGMPAVPTHAIVDNFHEITK